MRRARGSVSRPLGPVVYSHRETTNFLEEFITIDNGKTTVTDGGVNFGTFDNVVVRNTDDLHRREYQGLQFIVNYRPANDWAVGGHWTMQLRNHANFEGEAANQPGSYSIIGDRPEFYSAARHYPFGRTDDYQHDKLRLYTVYDLELGRAGTVSLGGVYRSARPFVKAELRNAFNKQPLIGFDTTVTPDPNSARDELGLPTGFVRGVPNFGLPLNNHTATGPHVPYPREFRFSVGFRF